MRIGKRSVVHSTQNIIYCIHQFVVFLPFVSLVLETGESNREIEPIECGD